MVWGEGEESVQVGAEVEGFLDGAVGEVLVAEGDDSALGDEEGQLVFAGIGEPRELDPSHLGAHARRKVVPDSLASGEEVRE